MDPTTQRLMEGAAGAAAEATYVDDVFSTTLYTATGSSLSLTTGQDLDAEGGMVWLKSRSATRNHSVVDSARGVDGTGNYKSVYPNLQDAEYSPGSAANAVATSFNSNGLTLGNNANTNTASDTCAAWTFRKAPGFFDVVTWTGDGTASRAIPHDLGSAPGFIAVKRTDSTSDWWCWHRGISTGNLALNDLIRLNTTGAKTSIGTILGTASSTTFEVGSDSSVNASGGTYVAYVYAHDDQSFGTDGDEAIISCGITTMPASGTMSPEINVGFEPQFLILKNANAGFPTNWYLFDSMRGISTQNSDALLNPDTTSAESESAYVQLTPRGFQCVIGQFGTSQEVIYIAIRRPNKPVTAATEVFTPTYQSMGTNMTTGFPVDLLVNKSNITGTNNYVLDRVRGEKSTLISDNTNGAYTSWAQPAFPLDNNTGVDAPYWGNPADTGSTHLFRRAPGFMDIVTYEGDGTSSRNVPHNLETSAELIIVKRMDSIGNWCVWSEYLTNNYIMLLSTTDAEIPVGSGYINSSTTTTFNIGSDTDVNASGAYYVGYLFDTLEGISKVGTYTGTGSDLDVDCGFSAGARYILIKRVDSTGDWYVFDGAMGITSGNVYYWFYNTNGAVVTTTDYIDPLNSGFTVTSSAPAEMNASGGTYLFLAVA